METSGDTISCEYCGALMTHIAKNWYCAECGENNPIVKAIARAFIETRDMIAAQRGIEWVKVPFAGLIVRVGYIFGHPHYVNVLGQNLVEPLATTFIERNIELIEEYKK